MDFRSVTMAETVALISGDYGSHRRLAPSDRHLGKEQTMNGQGSAQQHAVNGVDSPAAWSGEPMHAGNGTADGGGSAAIGNLQNGATVAAEPRLFSDDADDFLCGTAISVYQNSGGPDSNWGEYEDRHKWYSRTIAVRSLFMADGARRYYRRI